MGRRVAPGPRSGPVAIGVVVSASGVLLEDVVGSAALKGLTGLFER